MEPVVSRYRILPIIGRVLIIIIALACWYTFFAVHADAKFQRRKVFVGTVFTLAGTGLIISFARNVPQLTISDSGIYLKSFLGTNRLIDWVKDVNLIATEKSWGGDNVTRMHLSEGASFFIEADMYANMRALRQNLRHYVFPQKQENPGYSFSPATHVIFGEESFAGNPWLTINTLTIVMAAGICTVAFLLANRAAWIYFLLLPPLFLRLGSQMFYFRFSNEKLTIRNHYWFWYQKTYLLQNINICMIEHASRRASQGLCIICHDLDSKKYAGGSLRAKDWRALHDKLKRCYISTKDDYGW
jgi:hypothetical protein